MKSLKVKIARAERFGRLSTKSVELSDGNFTVVLGPNESGKSTLAELISWVLAGRRKSMDRRFLTSSEIDLGETADLKAGIEGFIEDLRVRKKRCIEILVVIKVLSAIKTFNHVPR